MTEKSDVFVSLAHAGRKRAQDILQILETMEEGHEKDRLQEFAVGLQEACETYLMVKGLL